MVDRILLVVEGDGDKAATRTLVRRMLGELHERFDIGLEIHRRNGLDHLRSRDWSNYRRYLEAAHSEHCPILWIIDCDDDCARAVAQEMTAIATQIGVRQPFAVALWVREYETMFIHDWTNISQVLGTQTDVQTPHPPERIRGAKGWISRQLPKNQIYKETVHQERLSAQVDIQHLLESYSSFVHFNNVLGWLIRQDNAVCYQIA